MVAVRDASYRPPGATNGRGFMEKVARYLWRREFATMDRLDSVWGATNGRGFMVRCLLTA